jgi:hypothetical protein
VAVPRHVVDRAVTRGVLPREDLHEPHAPFEQPAGREALLREDFALGILGAVEVVCGLRFLRQIDRLRRRRLDRKSVV